MAIVWIDRMAVDTRGEGDAVVFVHGLGEGRGDELGLPPVVLVQGDGAVGQRAVEGGGLVFEGGHREAHRAGVGLDDAGEQQAHAPGLGDERTGVGVGGHDAVLRLADREVRLDPFEALGERVQGRLVGGEDRAGRGVDELEGDVHPATIPRDGARNLRRGW